MKSLVDHLSQYAAYHRDPHNIATHFVGIPLIVIAVATLLSRPQWMGISPAVLVMLASAVFYLRLELRLGLLMTLLLALTVWLGHALAGLGTAAWLGWGIGLFVVGWVFQFVGHYYEGRKPAFIDDVTGLIVGPLFVVVELGFLLGWREDLRRVLAGAARDASARLQIVRQCHQGADHPVHPAMPETEYLKAFLVRGWKG